MRNRNKQEKTSFVLKPIYFAITMLLLFVFATVVVSRDNNPDSVDPKPKHQQANQKSKVSSSPPIQLQRVVSPEGEATLMKIRVPDRKFKKEGEYKVILRCDTQTEDFQNFVTKVEAIRKDYHTNKELELGKPLPLAKMPWQEVDISLNTPKDATTDATTNATTDATTSATADIKVNKIFSDITFREAASYQSRSSMSKGVGGNNKPITVNTQIETFDANGDRYLGWVHKGATIRVSADVVPYYNPKAGVGVSLRLKAIQFIRGTGNPDSQPHPQRGATSYGFNLIEENWSPSPAPSPIPSPIPPSSTP